MEEVLPDLAGFAAAALLILLACAIALLGALIANTFGRLPLVGSWVTANIVQSLTDAANAVITASEATWNFSVQMLKWMAEITVKPFIWTYDFAVAAYRWLQVLFTQTIPEAEARALTYAAQLVTGAETDARALFTLAEQDLIADVTALDTRVTSLFTTAETYAAGLVSTAERDLSAAITNAEVSAAEHLSAAETSILNGLHSVASSASADLASLAAQANSVDARLARDIITESQAVAAAAAANLSAVAGGIYTDLDTWGVQAVADAWPDAEGDLAALRATLGADFPWLQDLLPLLAGAGAAGLLGALIRSLAAANVVTNLANDCTIPNCRNLSGLGNDLQELLSLAATSALIAWVIFCVTDPVAAATDIQDVLLDPLQDVITAASHLFGGP